MMRAAEMENRGRVWEILEVTLVALTDEMNMEVGRKKQIKEKILDLELWQRGCSAICEMTQLR